MSDTDQKDELPIHVDQDTCKGGFAGAICRRQEVDQNMMLTQTLHCDYDQLCRLDGLGLADSAEGDQNVVYQEFKEQLTSSEEGWYETGLPWKTSFQTKLWKLLVRERMHPVCLAKDSTVSLRRIE